MCCEGKRLTFLPLVGAIGLVFKQSLRAYAMKDTPKGKILEKENGPTTVGDVIT